MRNAPIELLNIFLVLCILIITGALITKTPERETFSAIYILDPEGTLLNYPKTSGEVNFTIGVYNHLGEKTEFEVLLKLGDNSTKVGDDVPAILPILESYKLELEHDHNMEIPIKLNINETGRKRVIAELWNKRLYTGRWIQLWLN